MIYDIHTASPKWKRIRPTIIVVNRQLLLFTDQFFVSQVLFFDDIFQKWNYDCQASNKHLIRVLWLYISIQKWLKLCRMQLIEQKDEQLQSFWGQDIFFEIDFFVQIVEHVKQKVEGTFAQELLLKFNSSQSLLLLSLQLLLGHLLILNDVGIAMWTSITSLLARLAGYQLLQASQHVPGLIQLAIEFPFEHLRPLLGIELLCILWSVCSVLSGVCLLLDCLNMLSINVFEFSNLVV